MTVSPGLPRGVPIFSPPPQARWRWRSPAELLLRFHRKYKWQKFSHFFQGLRALSPLPSSHCSYIHTPTRQPPSFFENPYLKPCPSPTGQVFDYLPIFFHVLTGQTALRADAHPFCLYMIFTFNLHKIRFSLGILTGFRSFQSPHLVNLTIPKIWAMMGTSTCRCRIDGIADSMLIGAFQHEEV